MAVYAHDSQFMTRRGAVLVTIIALHVFIAWALATGLARRALEVIAPPIQTDIVEERKVEKEPPPPPPRPSSRTAPKLGKGFPNTEDYYPAASKRLGEEGTPTLHVCIGANGKLSAPPTVTQSSGSARLDEGAVNLAKAGAGHYVAATEDGKPVDGCFDFRIKFQMTK